MKDPEASKNLLLGKAVEDAVAKAGVLAKEIQSIDYSRGTINFEVEPMRNMAMCVDECAEESFDMDTESDDIEVSDTVTIVWEIA